MDPSLRRTAAAMQGEPEAEAAEVELARRVVAWLTEDAEGRALLRTLAERPWLGSALLRRRLRRADRAAEPLAWEGPGRPPGLARQLSLAGAGLCAGGFAAFMLGVLTLGKADPGFPPLSIFGAVLLLLSALPPLAAHRLRAHDQRVAGGGPDPSRPLTVLATVAGSVALAAAVAVLTAR